MSMDQLQLPHSRWALKLEIGEHQTLAPRVNESIWVTDVFLVDPASAADHGAVDACFGQGDVLASLWAERPIQKLSPPVELPQGLPLYVTLQGGDSSAAAGAVAVQFEGYIVGHHNNMDEVQEEAPLPLAFPGRLRRRLRELWSSLVSRAGRSASGEVGGNQEEVAAVAALSPEDDDATIDESDEEERDDGDVSFGAGMRVDDVESQIGTKCIRVVCRYTRFSVPSNGGVQPVRGATKVHSLRLMVPPASDTVRSLRLASASLVGIVFPSHYREDIQDIWQVESLRALQDIPSRATGFKLLFEVGVFPAYCTKEFVCTTVDDMAEEVPLPRSYRCTEHRLPEPALCGGAGEDDCPICLDLLQGDDLVAWPGCGKPHVFHGHCLEVALTKSDRCPLCRRLWYIHPKRVLDGKYVRPLVATTLLGLCLFVSIITFVRWIMYS